MGGRSEELGAYLKDKYGNAAGLAGAFRLGREALGSVEGKEIPPGDLEVAVLDRTRPRRKFRRLKGPDIEQLLS